MPHESLKLIPGVDQTRTQALNEAALWESNLIRFMPDRQGQGLPQKIGGWTQFITTPTDAWSTVRALHAWADTNSNNYLAIGAENSLWATDFPNSAVNVTPQYYTANIPVSASTTVGSSEVVITDANSNVSSFDSVYISTPISVGGVVLSGFYPCEANGANAYSVIARNVIGIETLATSTVVNGGAVPTFTSTISPSTPTITVTLADHGYSVGSTFAALPPTTVGGVVIQGNYIVTSIISPSQFTIAAANAPTSAVTVSMNGGNAQIIYFLGQTATAPPVGYGAGGYGSGGYGTGVSYSGVGRVLTSVGIVGNGVTATATPAIGVYVTPGSLITVSGSTNFNGTYTVLAATSTTFTFASTANFTNTGVTIAVTAWGFEMPVTTDKDWSLDNWGEYLISSPKGGEVFYWNPSDTNGHAVVIPNAPLVNEGCFVAMPERQIVAYGSTFTGFQDPMLIRWCDIGNFTNWVGTVVNQAGSYRIPKGSKIVGGIQGPQQGLIWTDLGLWAMQYVNQPLIYTFNEIASGCGLVGRKAMGIMAGTTYWMSQSQFFRLSGNGVEPVQCPIWDVIFQDIDTSYWENVRCAPNSRFGEIAWYYPTIGSNGVPTKYVKYNTLLNQWDFGTLTRTAWIDQSVFGPPIGADSNLKIYQHETSNDADGSAILSSFKTGYFAIQEGDLKTFVDQVWPDMKWGLYDGTQNATVTITFYTADYPGDTPKSYSYTVTKNTQFVTPRLRARLVAIKIESSDLGSFWRVGNIRYRYQPDGKF
jgi:hypothetical protein